MRVNIFSWIRISRRRTIHHQRWAYIGAFLEEPLAVFFMQAKFLMELRIVIELLCLWVIRDDVLASHVTGYNIKTSI